MKICFLCGEYPPVPHGGAGTFTQVTARALVRDGHEVRIAGLYDARVEAPDHEIDQGVSVWRLRAPRYRGGGVAGRVALYRLVKGWIREGKVEVVDAPDHDGPFAGWPRLAAPLVLRAGGSYSYFLHELGQPIPRKTFQVERLSYRRADAWIAKSEYIGRKTRALFRLPNGPDATLYNPVDAPPTVAPFERRRMGDVVFTGTLTAKKGVISLVDAWASIRARVPHAVLHVYGKDGVPPVGYGKDGVPPVGYGKDGVSPVGYGKDGVSPVTTSMKAYLQERLAASGTSGVHFHDHVSRATIACALSTARVAVFPSYAEGFAWAPLEAMAAGCATVYSRYGSGPELMVDGRDGLLVDPDEPAEIADAVSRVLDDDDLARRLGTAGRQRVLSSFASERLLPANVRFYENVIRSFRASR